MLRRKRRSRRVYWSIFTPAFITASGGVPESHAPRGKEGVLRSFRPQIFFDDQRLYCEPASIHVPTAQVLRPSPSPELLVVSQAAEHPAPSQPQLFGAGAEQPSVPSPVLAADSSPSAASPSGRAEFVETVKSNLGRRFYRNDRKEAELWYEVKAARLDEAELKRFLDRINEEFAALLPGHGRPQSIKVFLQGL